MLERPAMPASVRVDVLALTLFDCNATATVHDNRCVALHR